MSRQLKRDGPFDYGTLNDLLGRSPHRSIKRTWIYTSARRCSGHLEIWMHQVPILKYYPDGVIVPYAGEFKTQTTKDRLNDYLPGWSISQRKRTWYITGNEQTHPFADNMILLPNWQVDYTEPPVDTGQVVDTVDRYVRRFFLALNSGKVTGVLHSSSIKTDDIPEIIRKNIFDVRLCYDALLVMGANSYTRMWYLNRIRRRRRSGDRRIQLAEQRDAEAIFKRYLIRMLGAPG